MSNSNSSSSGGIGFCGLLCIVFVVLKLTNYINWSWWWVTSPIWLPLTIILGCAIIVFCFLGLLTILTTKKRRR